MKTKLLCLFFVLFMAGHSFSQSALKKEMQKKTDTIPKPQVAKTAVVQQNVVPASAVNAKPKTETAVVQQNVVPASAVNNKPRSEVLEVKNNNLATNNMSPANKTTVVPQKESVVPPPPNYSRATSLDAFVTLTTGVSAQTFPVTSGENKDPDTHWSCGIFDQNGRPITSFHDDSDHDEYIQGSVTGPLQMHIDNPAVFGDFANGGKIHINIAPNGNDTWGVTKFVLTIDFQNPALTQTITWDGFGLTQDKRDVDLVFKYDGKNLVVRH